MTLVAPPHPLMPAGPGRAPRRRRSRPPILAITLVGLIAASVVFNVVVDSELGQARDTGNIVQFQLSGAEATLSSLVKAVAAQHVARDARRQALARTEAEITSVEASIRSATATGTLQSDNIATIKGCLAGVSAASGALGAGHLPDAINAIDAVSALCLSLYGASGPAYPFNFPDPSVLTVGSEYYAFATNSAAGNVQVIESSDLSHWSTLGDALPHLAMWAQPNNIWAPGVIHLGNHYLLFYSADFAATQKECLSVAVASQPQGPYIDSTTWPLVCQLDLGGSLDPSPFQDANGVPYLTWKSEGLGSQPPMLWSQQLSPDGTGLVPGTAAMLLQPSQPWQGGIVEGPDMVVSGGKYRLLYSANSWRTAGYAIGVANCSGPSGPCSEAPNGPLLASGDAFNGPGGPSVFTDVQGTMWLAFHAWLPGEVGFPNSRLLFLRLLTVTSTGAQVGP